MEEEEGGRRVRKKEGGKKKRKVKTAQPVSGGGVDGVMKRKRIQKGQHMSMRETREGGREREVGWRKRGEGGRVEERWRTRQARKEPERKSSSNSVVYEIMRFVN